VKRAIGSGANVLTKMNHRFNCIVDGDLHN
jgi:hypothetical protein